MNTWDPDTADCSVPMDAFDAERESTLVYNATGEDTNEDAYVVGMKKDVFCKKNRIYYVAEVRTPPLFIASSCIQTPTTSNLLLSVQVKQIKKAAKEGQKTKLLFHFLGWGPSFDEWLEVGSDRIAAHNLHTKPDCHDPREQERWQAANGIGGETSAAGKVVSRLYAKAEQKKRKAEADKAAREARRLQVRFVCFGCIVDARSHCPTSSPSTSGAAGARGSLARASTPGTSPRPRPQTQASARAGRGREEAPAGRQQRRRRRRGAGAAAGAAGVGVRLGLVRGVREVAAGARRRARGVLGHAVDLRRQLLGQ